MLRRPWAVMLAGWLCSAATLAGTASTAQGSCGDWLAHSGVHGSQEGSDSASRFAMSTAIGAELPITDSRPVGCHGPHCHQAPVSPLPLAPVTLTTFNDPLGLSRLARTGATETWQFDARHESRVAAARGYFPAPDHPPRVS